MKLESKIAIIIASACIIAALAIAYEYAGSDSGLSEDDVYGLLEEYGGTIRLSDGSEVYVLNSTSEGSRGYDSTGHGYYYTMLTKYYADIHSSGDVLVLECHEATWREYDKHQPNSTPYVTVETTVKMIKLDSIIGIVVKMPSESIPKTDFDKL